MSRAIEISDDAIRQAAADRITAAALARQYGCSEATISKRSRRLGVKWHGRAATPAWYAEADQLCQQGVPVAEIAERLGISIQRLHTYRSTHGLTRKRTNWDGAILAAVESETTLETLARELGAHPRTISERAQRLRVRLITDAQKAANEAPAQPWSVPDPNEPFGDELDEWPASVAAPTLPEESRVPCVLIRGGEIVDEVAHGGTIIGRYDDFIEALQWLRLESPPCIVARACDYVALAFTQTKPKKAHKPINIFRE